MFVLIYDRDGMKTRVFYTLKALLKGRRLVLLAGVFLVLSVALLSCHSVLASQGQFLANSCGESLFIITLPQQNFFKVLLIAATAVWLWAVLRINGSLFGFLLAALVRWKRRRICQLFSFFKQVFRKGIIQPQLYAEALLIN